ncbi:MAG TPA: hypothetical protein ENH26_00025 [Candidatus Wolfebacteria bacterium]|nr:hypothetical protein [Candidatus Wolfebacteria bacterium]
MQHNQSLLEKELKTEKLSVGLPWKILLLAVILFGFTIFIYLSMIIGYRPYLNSQLSKVSQGISVFDERVDKEQQKNLTEFYSQLTNIQKLFNSHILASNIFDLLEENTHQGVYFVSMNLSAQENEARLKGLASSYRILSEQLELFRLNPKIEQVFLNNSKIKDGDIGFTIDIVLKSRVLSF